VVSLLALIFGIFLGSWLVNPFAVAPVSSERPTPTVERHFVPEDATPVPLAAVSPVASPTPSATATPLPTATLVPPTSTLTPLPTRCADAAHRFPATVDPESAVRAAFREYLARQGVTIDPASTLFAGLNTAYVERHAEVVAGWIAVTLQRERRGLAPFTLADYVASDVIVAVGPGEYQLRATVSPQGWAEMRAWPATTCEGVFMGDPANARWVDLMAASVGDITWALPTPSPPR
jgi:hypothetical protein